MRAVKIVAIVFIVLGVALAGFGFIQFQKDTRVIVQNPAELPVYTGTGDPVGDAVPPGTGVGSLTVDLTDNGEPDGAIVSTNGDIRDDDPVAEDVSDDAVADEAE